VIRIDNLREGREQLPCELQTSMTQILQGMAEFLDVAAIDEASFTALFGWPIMIVEQVEELSEVRSFEEGLHGRLSLLEAPSRWFDAARWIDGDAFALFVTIENDAGGPQFVIPRAIAEQERNVSESIRLKAGVDC
jgi:hypothetical protein